MVRLQYVSEPETWLVYILVVIKVLMNGHTVCPRSQLRMSPPLVARPRTCSSSFTARPDALAPGCCCLALPSTAAAVREAPLLVPLLLLALAPLLPLRRVGECCTQHQYVEVHRASAYAQHAQTPARNMPMHKSTSAHDTRRADCSGTTNETEGRKHQAPAMSGEASCLPCRVCCAVGC